MSYKLWMFSIIDVSSEKNNLYEMFWTVGLGLKQVSSPRDFCQTRTNYLGHKALLDLIWVTCPRFHVTQRVNNWEYKTKFIDSYSKQIKALFAWVLPEWMFCYKQLLKTKAAIPHFILYFMRNEVYISAQNFSALGKKPGRPTEACWQNTNQGFAWTNSWTRR